MGFTFNKKLPIPKEIKAMYPLSPENAAKKAQRDKEIIHHCLLIIKIPAW